MHTTATPSQPIQSGTPQRLPDEGQGAGPTVAVQRIIQIRRDYNCWVASETMEGYGLRFKPQRFRKWSEGRVADTAFGAASFLIL